MQKRKEKNFGAGRYEFASSWEKMFRPKRRSDIRTRIVQGEAIVLDHQQEYIHQFNKTASYIWDRCNGLNTSGEITNDLCEAFEVDYGTALKDVLATVERLQQSKLLEDS